jgi:hypothetical protein
MTKKRLYRQPQLFCVDVSHEQAILSACSHGSDHIKRRRPTLPLGWQLL